MANSLKSRVFKLSHKMAHRWLMASWWFSKCIIVEKHMLLCRIVKYITCLHLYFNLETLLYSGTCKRSDSSVNRAWHYQFSLVYVARSPQCQGSALRYQAVRRSKTQSLCRRWTALVTPHTTQRVHIAERNPSHLTTTPLPQVTHQYLTSARIDR